MIECDAKEIPADKLKEAFKLGQEHIDISCDFQAQFIKKLDIQTKEVVYNKPGDEVLSFVSGILNKDKLSQMTGNTKVPFNDLYREFEKEVLALAQEKFADNEHFTTSKVKMAVFDVIKKFIRHRTITDKLRIDDRALDQIRPIYCEVGLFARNHGTGLFRR